MAAGWIGAGAGALYDCEQEDPADLSKRYLHCVSSVGSSVGALGGRDRGKGEEDNCGGLHCEYVLRIKIKNASSERVCDIAEKE